MAKKYTDQQKALKLTWLRPEKRLHLSRQAWRGRGTWPCAWGFWTNGVQLKIRLGKPWQRMGGAGMPVSQFAFGCGIKPFNIIAWWGNERIFWIGDRAWKKALSENG